FSSLAKPAQAVTSALASLPTQLLSFLERFTEIFAQLCQPLAHPPASAATDLLSLSEALTEILAQLTQPFLQSLASLHTGFRRGEQPETYAERGGKQDGPDGGARPSSLTASSFRQIVDSGFVACHSSSNRRGDPARSTP